MPFDPEAFVHTKEDRESLVMCFGGTALTLQLALLTLQPPRVAFQPPPLVTLQAPSVTLQLLSFTLRPPITLDLLLVALHPSSNHRPHPKQQVVPNHCQRQL